ncbi:hypothetical protein OROMI_019792 [Orobanche minor]
MKTHLCFSFLMLLSLFLLLFPVVISRPPPNGSSQGQLISDGVDPFSSSSSSSSSSNPVRLRENTDSVEEDDTECEQLYGFLPCSKTIPGHLFLILVYEYMLFHAESYVDSGGKKIFKILGPGVFGASASRLLALFRKL